MGIRRLFEKNKWFFAIRSRKTAPLAFGDSAGYAPLQPPPDRFWADPFLIESEQKTWVFFEDYRYKLGRGIISCAEVVDAGRIGPTLVALDLPIHLSYPFVFAAEGAIWMIPETSERGTVELYRAHRFPADWRRETVLLRDRHLSDSTLFAHENRWWMFSCEETGRGSEFRRLCIFSSPSVLGPWTPHAANPVVDDAAAARPAGRVWHEDGRIIRVAQDCVPGYGYGLHFLEVTRLNQQEFAQSSLARIGPDWIANGAGAGTHAYDRSSRYEVIDGFTRRVDVRGKLLALEGFFNRRFERSAGIEPV